MRLGRQGFQELDGSFPFAQYTTNQLYRRRSYARQQPRSLPSIHITAHGPNRAPIIDLVRARKIQLLPAVTTTIVACSLALPASSLASASRVLLVGDSITESLPLRTVTWQTLASQVGAKLHSRGFRVGTARGWIPIHSSWDSPINGVSRQPANPWQLSGPWLELGFQHLGFPAYGPEGLSATGSPGATAQIATRTAHSTIFYTAIKDGGRLSITTPRERRNFSTSARVPTGREIAINGSPISLSISGGPVRISGLVEADPQSMTLAQSARSGAMAIDSYKPAQQQARRQLKASLTVIMFGTNEENRELVGSRYARSAFDIGIYQQAKLSRPGRCVVVPHAPNIHSWSQQAAFRAVARRAAARVNCLYRPWLASVWNGSTSRTNGLTYDGIHPTPKGYGVLSSALARGLATVLPRN